MYKDRVAVKMPPPLFWLEDGAQYVSVVLTFCCTAPKWPNRTNDCRFNGQANRENYYFRMESGLTFSFMGNYNLIIY